jgi:hypothetical protein
MKLSRVIVSMAVAPAVLFVANVAKAQQGPPTWTDVLNLPGDGSIASGNFWQVGGSPQFNPIWDTDLAGINYTLSLSVPYLSGQQDQTGTYSCGTVVSPVTFIESNLGIGVKGIGFEGTFFAHAGGVPLAYQPNNNLFESVFFNEDPCYGLGSDGISSDGSTSREYGYFLSGNGSGIYVYWGTHENQLGLEVQAVLLLPNVEPNTQYYFEIYPTGDSTSCSFQVNVLDAEFATVYSNLIPVDSYNSSAPGAQPTITLADPGFCGSVTAQSGDTGYVSANISAAPLVSGIVPASQDLNLNLRRVFVVMENDRFPPGKRPSPRAARRMNDR